MKGKGLVYVGLSGGVDSSTTAAILKDKGYQVVGVFIRVWSPDWLPCTWPEERRDAMSVAAKLDIPFITLNLEKEYKEGVADYMISEYKSGRTPNPDVMCNKAIKFGSFYDYAMRNNADFVATGHYARCKDGRLYRGIDENKDQSYFLWNIKSEQLKNILLPLGSYRKEEVRKMAEKYDLPTSSKKDSQGVCFLGKLDMKEFLKHYIEEKKGDVINTKGEVIGEHDGAVYYTLGQRHGYKLFNKTVEEKPKFIVEKNIEANTITVSENNVYEEVDKLSTDLVEVNWINYKDKAGLEAQVRYRQKPQKCTLKGNTVKFADPQILSPGQSVVIYDKDECIGGGVIK